MSELSTTVTETRKNENDGGFFKPVEGKNQVRFISEIESFTQYKTTEEKIDIPLLCGVPISSVTDSRYNNLILFLHIFCFYTSIIFLASLVRRIRQSSRAASRMRQSISSSPSSSGIWSRESSPNRSAM